MATVENVLDVLLIFESAAGAHIMMREFSGNPLTLMEEAELFEKPEGFNDSETERLIKSLTPTQFTALVDKLKLINEEYKLSYESDYEERVGGFDVDQMLA